MHSKNRPKSHKEIFERKRDSPRRSAEQIKDDIYDVLHISRLLHSTKRRNLDILLHELEETALHDGASNPYC
jgi:uncharacterized sporulation protein YeaH/YhbH (DUF444 family)